MYLCLKVSIFNKSIITFLYTVYRNDENKSIARFENRNTSFHMQIKIHIFNIKKNVCLLTFIEFNLKMGRSIF